MEENWVLGEHSRKGKDWKCEIMSETGSCFWPWDIRADMNYWNYGSVNLCVVSPSINSEQVLFDCRSCSVRKPSGHGVGETSTRAPACSFCCLTWIICWFKVRGIALQKPVFISFLTGDVVKKMSWKVCLPFSFWDFFCNCLWVKSLTQELQTTA